MNEDWAVVYSLDRLLPLPELYFPNHEHAVRPPPLSHLPRLNP